MNEEIIDKIGRELMAAIETALAADPRVQACLDQARSAGIGFRVALNRARAESGVPVEGVRPVQAAPAGAARGLPAPAYSVTESDRRFLRSLRIAVDGD